MATKSGKRNEAEAYLKGLGIDPTGLLDPPPTVDSVNGGTAQAGRWVGSDVRLDLFTYAGCDDEKMIPRLEGKGFIRLPKKVDIRPAMGCGSDFIVLARPLAKSRIYEKARAERDTARRTGRRKKSTPMSGGSLATTTRTRRAKSGDF